MARYFFRFVSDHREFPAHEGLELPNLESAITHAKLAIGTVFNTDMNTYDWSGWRVSIGDDEGNELSAVPITETLIALKAASDRA